MPPIITNKHGLPEPIVRAAEDNQHRTKTGGISVTQLILPPRIRILQERHDYELDVSEMLWMLAGTALHKVLQEYEDDAHSELFLWADFTQNLKLGSYLLTGNIDRLKNGVLSDWKYTSVWSVIYGQDDWEPQVNLYAELARRNGLRVDRLEVVAFLRDWNSKKAQYDTTYPPCQLAIIPIEMWSQERCQEYILERFRLHRDAEKLADEELPMCTPEERWEKPTEYAVMKRGRQSAVRAHFETEQEAVLYAKQNNIQGAYIEMRPGKCARCEGNYCHVAEICERLQ